jgi:hypothetical protein
MKKFLAIAFVTVLAFSILTACKISISDEKKEPTDDNGTPAENDNGTPGELTLDAMKKVAEDAGYTIGGMYTTNNYDETLVQPAKGFSIGADSKFSVGVHEFASENDLREYTDYVKDKGSSTLYVSGNFCVEFKSSAIESEVMSLFAAAGWDFK